MLDRCHQYSFQWHYSFNPKKSTILVVSESRVSRRTGRLLRSWHIGNDTISESDTVKHLGILLTVSGSSLSHTLKSISSARSVFYAIQSVSPRFGSLHPLTSLRLFKAYSLCILKFGYDVLFPTRSELLMLDRSQLAILKSILGLPYRTSSIAIHTLLGTLPMSAEIIRSRLSFLLRILLLSDLATSKAILLYRFSHPLNRSFVTCCSTLLEDLSLPSIEQLLSLAPCIPISVEGFCTGHRLLYRTSQILLLNWSTLFSHWCWLSLPA